MFCSKCGSQIVGQAQFCSGCGSPAMPNQAAPQTPGPYVFVPQQNAYPTQMNRVAPMSFGMAISSFFKNYANFNGRARRSEYWFAGLFIYLVTLFLLALDYFNASYYTDFTFFTAIYWLWVLATFLPGLAMAVRRLHDVGRFGTYIWMGLIPIAGGIILLVEFLKDSQPGPNQFGNPVK